MLNDDSLKKHSLAKSFSDKIYEYHSFTLFDFESNTNSKKKYIFIFSKINHLLKSFFNTKVLIIDSKGVLYNSKFLLFKRESIFISYFDIISYDFNYEIYKSDLIINSGSIHSIYARNFKTKDVRQIESLLKKRVKL